QRTSVEPMVTVFPPPVHCRGDETSGATFESALAAAVGGGVRDRAGLRGGGDGVVGAVGGARRGADARLRILRFAVPVAASAGRAGRADRDRRRRRREHGGDQEDAEGRVALAAEELG